MHSGLHVTMDRVTHDSQGEERRPMLSWTDCPARTPEQQIIFAQLEILRRLNPTRTALVSRPSCRERQDRERP
jgi:hypothetical protein